MTFILPSFGASAISAVPSGGGGGGFSNTYSVDFDGTDDYLSLGNISSLSSASAFTLSTWVKTSTNNKYIYSSYASGLTDSIQMYFHSGGSLRCIVGTGSSWYQIETSSTTLADGTWKNFTFVFSGGNYLKIYANGSEETTSFVNGTNTVPTTTEANAGNTPRIADYVAGGNALDGLIDEVALFNSALSASQITNIYRGEDDGGSGGTNRVPGDLSTFNPVGWWRMGDNDGGTGTTITDQGSGGNDGTLTNGPTFSTDVPVAFANTRSLSFDGTNDYGDAGVVSALQNASAFSFSVWFKKGAASEWPAWGGYSSGSDNISGHGYLNDLWFNVRNGVETRYVVPSSNLPSDTTDFHHYVYTFDGGTFKVYVDGTERSGTKSNSGTTSSGTANFNFKIGFQGFHYDQGLYDEFAIFSSALSSSDVTAIYNSGTPDSLSSYSPVAWWRMEEGSGTSVVNTANSGTNDVTLYNGPTFSTDTP
jgi:hypothetical protein